MIDNIQASRVHESTSTTAAAPKAAEEKVTLRSLGRDFAQLTPQAKGTTIGIGVGVLLTGIGSVIERGGNTNVVSGIVLGAALGALVGGSGTRAVRNFTEGSTGNKIASSLFLTGTTALGVSIAKQATNLTTLTKIKGGFTGLAVGMVVLGSATGIIRAINNAGK